ncbi:MULTISPECIES: type II CAAX prenyl endopeptidase Rce1 family protein [Myroides]|uniref:CPBP family intramembrane metalloprotease n=1 Tax=Myroides albus TaxID=2562892 RepID=A0A6I3LNV9_9FLAO|nr:MULTISPECIES: CPBP family glutamic-type intramembrane protease [Myroides]MTG97665.1 CPBP family intramembrane metalloprotease [Myroides albus]MVX35664.1 CPBP family intramembrane metalloprotease [Myroides sp. LoEW2-1]UVD78789.1 CPBP family glutamic-type intramembrane protease [Myroides albus]
MTLKELLTDFFLFAKKPNLQGVVLSPQYKLFNTLKLWGLCLFSIVALQQILDLVLDIPEPDLIELVLNELGVVPFILFAVVIGPFIEELSFRLPMRFKPSYLFIGFILTSAYFLFSVDKLNETVANGLSIVTLCLFVVLTYLIGKKKEVLKKLYTTYFSYIFYLLTLIFGFIHITNFEEITSRILILSPLIVFPQFALGIMMGYVRIRYGFWYSFLFHLINNGFAVLVLLIARSYFPELL